MTVTSEARAAYSSGALEFTPAISWNRVAKSLDFCIVLCSLFVFCSFYFDHYIVFPSWFLFTACDYYLFGIFILFLPLAFICFMHMLHLCLSQIQPLRWRNGYFLLCSPRVHLLLFLTNNDNLQQVKDCVRSCIWQLKKG